MIVSVVDERVGLCRTGWLVRWFGARVVGLLPAGTRYCGRGDVAALARAIEEAAVQAALEPDTPTGVSVPAEATR